MKKSMMAWIMMSMFVLGTLPVFAQAIIADHNCTDISMIPRDVLDSAKVHFKMTYGHTSHGSQIVTGMSVLMGYDTLYDFNNDHYYYQYGSGSPAPDGDLSFWDYVPTGDLGSPDRYSWATRTHDMLDGTGYTIYPHGRNAVMWSWCGQVDGTYEDIQVAYLDQMNQLEIDYPDVTFIYMTGHLTGTGSSGNVHQRNEQIRQFCIANDKVLFDFADIERYDPDDVDYLDLGADDACNYTGGNWADEWCTEHSDTNLCDYCDCAHSRALNCNRKGRAFWWMMARLEGWIGSPENVTVITDETEVNITWSPVPGAASYRVYSSDVPDAGFSQDFTGAFSDTTWTTTIPTGGKKFYYVTAMDN